MDSIKQKKDMGQPQASEDIQVLSMEEAKGRLPGREPRVCSMWQSSQHSRPHQTNNTGRQRMAMGQPTELMY